MPPPGPSGRIARMLQNPEGTLAAGTGDARRAAEPRPQARSARDGVADPRGGDFLHAVLLRPEIPHNTGAIGRTCVALGCDLGLVRPLGFALSDEYVRRAGLDYW